MGWLFGSADYPFPDAFIRNVIEKIGALPASKRKAVKEGMM